MTPLQIELAALVLLAAAIHAGWNAMVKTSGDRFITLMVIIGTGSVIGAVGAAVLPLPAPAAWPYLAVAVVFHNAYYATMLAAYRHGDLSLVYPIARGSAPLLVTVGAALFAGEVPGPLGVTGVVLVSAGVVALSLRQGSFTATHWQSIAFAVLNGLAVAAFTVVDGLGARKAGLPWSFIVWLNLLCGVPMIAIAISRRRAEAAAFLRAQWRPAVTGGVLSTAGFALVLFALSQGAMAHVTALRETSVLFAALIGVVQLKESFGARRLAAAAVIVVGLVLLQTAG